MKGGDVSSYGLAIDKLAKVLAAKETARHMIKARNNLLNISIPGTIETGSSMPPKSYCKQFFESFPAHYRWNVAFANMDRYFML
jgi:hypothetical protein